MGSWMRMCLVSLGLAACSSDPRLAVDNRLGGVTVDVDLDDRTIASELSAGTKTGYRRIDEGEPRGFFTITFVAADGSARDVEAVAAELLPFAEEGSCYVLVVEPCSDFSPTPCLRVEDEPASDLDDDDDVQQSC